TFKSDGTLSSPTTMNLALSFGGTTPSTASVALDISTMTQFYGDFLPRQYTKDGFAASNMTSFNFDSNGNVTGSFEDNTQRKIYQLALGVFSNPNALEAINGNVYKPSNDSGAALITTAGASGYAKISPNAHELSNVDMGNEFTKMMMTQTAYNASSTVFRTADEMLTIARDLKR
ncbi:MAG TPA: flagellar hook-basal body complex protein, partial [Magnetovibrio sp.]